MNNIRTYILEYLLPEIINLNVDNLGDQKLLELFHELEYKYYDKVAKKSTTSVVG